MQTIVRLVRKYFKKKDYCIITPYDAQRNAIGKALKDARLRFDNVFNVDSFQGMLQWLILSLRYYSTCQNSQSNDVRQETKRTTWLSPSSEQVLRGFSSPRTESMSCWLAVRRGWLSWRSGPLLRGRRGKPFSASLWYNGNLPMEMRMYGLTGRTCLMARRLWLGPIWLLRLIWHLCLVLRPEVIERTSCLVWHVSLLWITLTDHADEPLANTSFSESDEACPGNYRFFTYWDLCTICRINELTRWSELAMSRGWGKNWTWIKNTVVT